MTPIRSKAEVHREYHLLCETESHQQAIESTAAKLGLDVGVVEQIINETPYD